MTHQTDTSFRTYLKAFFNHMLTGMSGPLSVPFAALALWVSSSSQKILWGCLAVICAMFASYRVWSKERQHSWTLVAQKDSELVDLRDRLVTLGQRKPALSLKISVEGTPPSQVLRVVGNRPVTVSRVEYMLSTEASIAGEDVSKQGEIVVIPISDKLLLQVWNTPRADRNQHDHSGPAKIGITISADDQTRQYILPVQMEPFWQENTQYRKIIGSKTFIERV